MPSVTALQSGSTAASSSATLSAYTNGNFYRECDFRWEPTVANFATGVGSITTDVHGGSSNNLNWITTFSTKMNKTNTKRIVFLGRYSWARH